MLSRIRVRLSALESIGARAASTASSSGKQRLVVLGSGWAGFNVARQVNKSLYDVTVVSPNSYFSFTPFLASTVTGTLEYRCATEPVRGIKHVNYAQGWANNINFSKRTVEIEPALSPTRDATSDDLKASKQSVPVDKQHPYDLPYDKLVIAVGCWSASFGIKGVTEYAHFLKDVRDARAIRNKILERLEQALVPGRTEAEQRNLLQFSLVGGGATGVEVAAELHDFVRQDVYRLYPQLKDLVNIRVYDVAPGILMNFDDTLRRYAEKRFAREGVEVRPNSTIKEVGPDWLELEGGKREPFGLLVWSTGLASNAFIKSLKGLKKDEKTDSLIVNGQLNVFDEHGQSIPDVSAIGDNAMPQGGRLPATAQVASQMAKYMAKTLDASAKGTEIAAIKEFKWKNRGSMVLIGENRGLLDRSSQSISGPRSRLAGFSAWLVWRSYYMTLAMGWRNKILIPIYWTLAMFFGRDVTRF
ncbi:pyridine nucleotide-disulfide oxidoreductase-domain-containing protein [Kockovaella imperatae]|uniref:Pyridine nucleotide-disulfide oxidoreductase-domain-containing protein n=1 Tax=Kockovaella imperatae TaxID=4999 RepID=A0A1Y1UEC4_9TREE|nr:pyridine nucleotide-disulfide oxidoreductase-domain-containing protein [Kockovaella imperatae]ORX35425.1 pyridine nucleotide-disulfide oxidoreductase-domain-containing protein [Kockovaella imperatae]